MSAAAVVAADEERGSWRKEVGDVARAVSGGMLFGIPLLFTMEVWWIGSFTEPLRMLAVLAMTFVPVFLLTRTSGFRSTKDVNVREAVMDSIEAVALGLVTVAVMLVLLKEITSATPLREGLGKIVYEATPFSIGIALAHSFLRKSRDAPDDDGDSDDGEGEGDPNATLVDIGATLVGAVFVAFNIAPTDEVPMLAAAMGPAWLLLVMAASLVISYIVVFESGFSNEEQRHSQKGILQHPVTETVVSYLVALVTAAAMLWFFQRLGSGVPWNVTLQYVIVLGLPAAVGGAAGRLAV